MIRAKVIGVNGNLLDVRLGSGSVLRNVRCVGGMPVPGSDVLVEQTGGGYIAYSSAAVGEGVGFSRTILTTSAPPAIAFPSEHAATHAAGGTDEIYVGGLRGKLADPQDAGWLRGIPILPLLVGEGDGIVYSGKLGGFVGGRSMPDDVQRAFLRLPMWALSWAQFGIEETFENENYRASEPGYRAEIVGGRLTNGWDLTPGRGFTWTSIIWEDVNAVYTGVATASGQGWIRQDGANWHPDYWANYYCWTNTLYRIRSNTEDTLYLETEETPSAGEFVIRAGLPNWMAVFVAYGDRTTGGNGYVRLDVTLNGGDDWTTVLDTQNGIDLTQGAIPVEYPGNRYGFRITLTNDPVGPVWPYPFVDHVLIVTGPSVWG